MSDINDLQKIRKGTIPELITKYQRLINNIFDTVSKPLPDFIDVQNEDGEVTVTAEQQLYSFINTRRSALDNADTMLLKVNDLERELNDPNYKNGEDENNIESEKSKSPHPSKRHARNQK